MGWLATAVPTIQASRRCTQVSAKIQLGESPTLTRASIAIPKSIEATCGAARSVEGDILIPSFADVVDENTAAAVAVIRVWCGADGVR